METSGQIYRLQWGGTTQLPKRRRALRYLGHDSPMRLHEQRSDGTTPGIMFPQAAQAGCLPAVQHAALLRPSHRQAVLDCPSSQTRDFASVHSIVPQLAAPEVRSCSHPSFPRMKGW
ncbi:unnamed protein product, partial [Sphacelaria rigidula]